MAACWVGPGASSKTSGMTGFGFTFISNGRRAELQFLRLRLEKNALLPKGMRNACSCRAYEENSVGRPNYRASEGDRQRRKFGRSPHLPTRKTQIPRGR